ncbi:MAG: hypothetical protein JSW58_06040 [Candidatus Latescibacterota bacterium]|nr:MAG: hypothetical protein JSW58_06040 [Candidatus Latescibacterota bacterium]
MREWRKKGLLRTCVVYILCCTMGWLVYPKASNAENEIGAGAATPGEAAAPALQTWGAADFTLAGWEPSLSFLTTSARTDTTELEFPVEEEESRKHLIRDIGIFVVVSAFLAFFIVKVFIEEEEEQPPPETPGKEVPGDFSINQALQPSW